MHCLFLILIAIIALATFYLIKTLIDSYYLDYSSANSKELVVVVCGEDVKWIENYCNDFDLITVYNKCKKPLVFSSKNIIVIDSPNVGTCDHGYLSYITSRYNTLPDFVEFTKGSIKPTFKFYHCKDCNNTFNNVLKPNWVKIKNFKLDDYNFGGFKKNNSIGKQTSEDWEWHKSGYENMGEWIKDSPYLDEDMYKRNSCNIIFGGHFSATRSQILNVPLETWKHLLSQLNHTRTEVAHFIERSWRPLLCNDRQN